MNQHRGATIKFMLLAGVLVGSITVSRLEAQATAPVQQHSAGAPYRFQPGRDLQRINQFYGMVWGIDSLTVKSVESGELIRFSYRVVDSERAKLINDKKFEPALIDSQARVKLVVPQLEKVGLLRQSSTPIAGKSYWMAFSNKGGFVKRGDRVTVQIGRFHADGLVVE
ncbi:MAG: hypothetical protein JO182_16645 [Acidobacteriaceae bacterium]|nr:hypothetical protein [Acidobacteriaceae bacterium]MBV9036117.1 hypothetical protein [Acidobacteriaceae bacterium]MBV9226920.1 hypothetical protein [Acidobacteriaceae bacterium]